jgi:lipoate-protein ligase A
MAIDHALLQRAEQLGECWLRLYGWEPYCLSFGRHEPATRRYNVDRIRSLGLDTVRRPTGGRAVWHASELTYAVAAPSRHFGSLKAAYLEIHRMLADALRALGAPILLAPSAPASSLDAGACFAHPAGGELLAAGRKVVGSAQYRQGPALLQHGSILLENEQQVVLSLTTGAGENLANALEGPLPGGLSSVLGRPLQRLDVANAITRAAKLRWSGTWTPSPAPDRVLEAASPHYEHYRSPAWTWGR